MQIKDEGLVFPPFPAGRPRAPQLARRGMRAQADSWKPRCEMCGSNLIASHDKRVCVKCGFMTGSSEEI
jgi:hypothetical protein